jgi:hypothetical protein
VLVEEWGMACRVPLTNIASSSNPDKIPTQFTAASAS